MNNIMREAFIMASKENNSLRKQVEVSLRKEQGKAAARKEAAKWQKFAAEETKRLIKADADAARNAADVEAELNCSVYGAAAEMKKISVIKTETKIAAKAAMKAAQYKPAAGVTVKKVAAINQQKAVAASAMAAFVKGGIKMPAYRNFTSANTVQFGRVFKQMMHEEKGQGIYASLLILSDNTRTESASGHVVLQAMPSNREIRKIDRLGLVAPKTVEIIPGKTRPIERFSEFYLIVEMTPERATEVLNKRLYRRGNVILVDGDDSKYFLTDNEGTVVGDFFNEDGSVKDGVVVYSDPVKVNETVSAGQMKRLQVVLRAVNLTDKDGNVVDPSDILGDVTYGLTDTLVHARNALSADEISKLSTRIAQPWAPSIDGCKVKTYALYAGKFTMDDGQEYCDGRAFVSAELIVTMVNAWLKTKGSDLRFDVSAAIGWAVQSRPFSCKTLAISLTRKYINEVVRSQHLDKDVKVLHIGSITEEEQKEYDKLFTPQKKESSFYGKLIILTSDPGFKAGNGIDFLTDLNGDKATHDLNRETTLNVLATSHAEKGEDDGKLSTQFLPILFGESKTGKDIDKAKMAVISLLKSEIESRIDRLANGEARPLSVEDLLLDTEGNYSFRADNVLSLIAPDYVRENDTVLWRSITKASLKSLVKMVESFNHPLAGGYFKLGVEPACDFGENFLERREDGKYEVLVRAKGYQQTEDVIGIAKRYPGAATRAVLPIVSITVDEYCKRVDASELTKMQKRLVKESARAQVRCGLMLIPANDTILRLMDGADYDGDGAVCIFALDDRSTMIVNLALKGGSTEVILPDGGDDVAFKDAKLTIDQKVTAWAMLNYIAAKVPPVGIVIAKHVIFKQLRVEATRNPKAAWALFAPIRDAMRAAMVNGYGYSIEELDGMNTDKYESPFGEESGADAKKVEVDSAKIVTLVKNTAIYFAKDQNDGTGLAKLADDFDYAARYFSEKSIDAAKKLFPVNCHYLDELRITMLGREKGPENFNVEYADLDVVTAPVARNVRKGFKKSGMYNNITATTDIISDGYAVAHYTESKVDSSKKHKTTFVYDIFQEMRVAQVNELVGFVNKTVRTQEMPKEVLDYCRGVASNSSKNLLAADLVRKVCIREYLTVQSMRTKDVSSVRGLAFRIGGLDSHEKQNVADDLAKTIKALYNGTYESLTNMIRLATKKCSPVDRACIIVDAIYDGKNDGQGKSSILQRLLPEEYVLWVIDMSKRFGKWEVADRVDVHLHSNVLRNDVEAFKALISSGNVKAVFEAGVAYVKDASLSGEAILYTDDINVAGEWNLEMGEDGRVVAYRPIEDFIRVPEPNDTVCFITAPIPCKGVSVDEVKKVVGDAFGAGKKVHINKNNYVVYVDDVPTSRIDLFTNTPVRIDGKLHRAASDFFGGVSLNGKGYGYNTGVISDVVVSDYAKGGANSVVAIVVMKNAHYEEPGTSVKIKDDSIEAYRRVDELAKKNKKEENVKKAVAAETKSAKTYYVKGVGGFKFVKTKASR